MARLMKKVGILGMLMIMLFGVVGCVAPRGYHRVFSRPHPIIDIPNLITQFPNLNTIHSHNLTISDRLFLELDNNKYYITAYGIGYGERRGFWGNNRYSIYEYANNQHIGDFIIPIMPTTQGYWRTFSLGVFLYEYHLYYIYRVTRERFWLFNHELRRNYERYEFHRFNLLTGENEELTLDQFFATVRAVNPNAVLNW